MEQASVVYISAASNRYSRGAHSSNSSLVAFGSGKFVALWDAADPEDRGVSQTLSGHEGLVTCLRFGDDGNVLLSADNKGLVRCWRNLNSKWTTTCTLQAHAKSISTLAILTNWVVTGSSDATVNVWKLSSDAMTDELKLMQKLQMKGRYPLDIQLSFLPDCSSIIMAIATTERNISIWTRSEDIFLLAASLSGHEDWVKSLAFQNAVSGSNTLTLASGSQDGTIRLWNIEKYSRSAVSLNSVGNGLGDDDLLDAFEAALGDMAEGEEGGRQISMKRHIITVKADDNSSRQFSVTFDALLIGHEAAVTSLAWRPFTAGSDATPTLLSTSTDSSLILWSPSSVATSGGGDTTSLWINRQRFGDVGGQKLGGFVGGLWVSDGGDALAWGWNGGWRRWKCQSQGDKATHEVWSEVGAISGHNGPVRCLNWSPRGEYMISASLDQTTRLHGIVKTSHARASPVWHEIGRPQIHGYDLINAVFLDPLKFVSIADEKVARVFEAPRSFVTLSGSLGIPVGSDGERERPIGAAVPPLGLSNKALSRVDESEPQGIPLNAISLQRRPFEGELASATLWPESEKVFGHGYELISLAVSHSGKYIATACKATTAEHAVVRVYDTNKWQLFGEPLRGHSLSVTRITFSPGDRFILTVSRDRTWRLYTASESGYTPIAAEKPHARIIWDCGWGYEDNTFATAARDKTVKIWQSQNPAGTTWFAVATIKTREAATAVEFSPDGDSEIKRIAVGLESGEIYIYRAGPNALNDWREELVLDQSIAHVDHIYRLAWRPIGDNSSTASHADQLASCSEDGTVRLLHILTPKR